MMPIASNALITTLAAGNAGRHFGGILFGLLVIAAAVVVLVLVALATRRMLLNPAGNSDPGMFTLGDLRGMRDQGLLSLEEYDRAKRVLIAQGLSMLESPESGDSLNAEET